MKILIKNGKVIDPAQKIFKQMDILVDNGKIEKVEKNISARSVEIIDAEGKLVTPGFIDMHTHLREPGDENKETVESGLRAAIKGGFTTVCAMPNTKPACDNAQQARYLFERAREIGTASVLPIGAMTKDRKGKEMSEMGDLKDAGVLAVSDDGDSVQDALLMRRVLEYASMLDLLAISHCEDKSLSEGGVMNEGKWSTVLGLLPIPGASESIIVDRDIRLSEIAGARIHIAHVSTRESVEIIRRAKKKGIHVTCEATPHHMTLTDESLGSYDTNLKVNPPLRSDDDVAAIKKGLKDGTIDVIATDHAPHLISEKEKEFDYAPFGMIGLETALALAAEALVEGGHLDWPGLIEKLTSNPAGILKISSGTLAPGSVADITVIDPEKEWVYEENKIVSLSRNSPFKMRKMKAMVTDVIAGGKIVLRDGELVEK
ncbi:MAG: dihydroorotase [Candidatus Omnitrophica bacterium]|nr:dihydroorotase [Candidatus Omnitrophota bacterium]